MAESKSSDWAAAWIEQQRELLRRQAASAAAGAKQAAPKDAQNEPAMTDEVRQLGEKWRELGQSYLSGLAQYAQSGGAANTSEAGAHFKVGEEMLDLWRGAWSIADDARQGSTSHIADLLARLPPIGLAREHTEAWRELAAAQVECQRIEQELRAVLMRVQSEALNLLEQRVREREQQGNPLPSYRDLYDLWVECAERVYAKVAHSEAYCKLQAQLGNASMRLRSHQQKVIEHGLRQFDLPTRSELNTVHRQLREQKQKIASLEQQLRQASPVKPAGPSSHPSARKTARGKAAAAKKGRSR